MKQAFEGFARSVKRCLLRVLACAAPLLPQKQSASLGWNGILQNCAHTHIAGAKVRLAVPGCGFLRIGAEDIPVCTLKLCNKSHEDSSLQQEG